MFYNCEFTLRQVLEDRCIIGGYPLKPKSIVICRGRTYTSNNKFDLTGYYVRFYDLRDIKL